MSPNREKATTVRFLTCASRPFLMAAVTSCSVLLDSLQSLAQAVQFRAGTETGASPNFQEAQIQSF